MNIILVLKAIILGLIQGLTEFIPVSSSGHLMIFGKFLRFDNNDGRLFETAIQLGGTLAVCWLYKDKLLYAVKTFYKDTNSRDFIYKLLFAFAPSAILGLLFYNLRKKVSTFPIVMVISLIVGGFIILLVERYYKKPKIKKTDAISKFAAFKIGLFQAISIIPGVSRSGATIVGGLLSKLNRNAAVEFSFLLSILSTTSITVLNTYETWRLINIANLSIILIGLLVSFLTSILVIKWFINYISHNDLKIFGWYRIIFGIILLLNYF
jgi:undecaprenyl-diphosphatase